MGAALVPLVIVLAVLILIAAGVVVFGRRQNRRREQVSRSDTVRYRVPEGQDPASVLAGLNAAGYDAVVTSAEAGPVVAVRVESPNPQAREGIRTVIADAPLNLEGDRPAARDVRFLDE